MNSIILCEGSSDFVLLQYYMRTVYGWTDERTQNIRLDSIKRSRTLKKDDVGSGWNWYAVGYLCLSVLSVRKYRDKRI